MTHYQYLIIGGGMTADAAAKGIRELDANGSLGILSAEPDPPYDRPPLSKGMWKGKPKEKIWRQTEDKGATLHLDTRVIALDPNAKRVTDAKGNEYSYDKLLIATGGKPRQLAFGNNEIIYFRTVRDYERLRAQADTKQKFAVIGGGYIGSEIAAALAMVGKDVVLILKDETINGPKLPAGLGNFLNDYYREKGVDVQTQQSVTHVAARDEQFVVYTKGERDGRAREFVVDGVVAGLGITPNVKLPQDAHLNVDDGILVDEFLTTNHPDIYAAGDVASVYRPLMDKRARIEHEDNANSMGRAAGRNMAGAQEAFTYQPYFYSDLFKLGYEAIGELSSKLEKVEDWQEPYQKGVIYYLGDGRVRGVILWNVWEKLDAARALMAEPGPFTEQNVKGQIQSG